jgi:hypothetical protein
VASGGTARALAGDLEITWAGRSPRVKGTAVTLKAGQSRIAGSMARLELSE